MTRDEIRSAVLAALADVAPEADLAALAPGADLRETLDLDSMDFLRVVQAVAAATGVEIPDADAGRLATLAECIDYVAARA